jgi:hypothetical protein
MKNFNDILQTLIIVNEQLIDNKIDIEKAKVIGQNTQILINAAKVQLEYARQTKQTPAFLNELKGIGQKSFSVQLLVPARTSLHLQVTIRLWWHETHRFFKLHNAVEVPTIGVC